MTTFRDVLELVRAPAALTVLGDTVVGSHAATGGFTRRGWLLPLASAAIYSGGMALNDWADRRVDATERPERPIPSGRVSPAQALVVSAVCGAAGLALAAAGGGRRSLATAVPLTAAVVAYDVMAKPTAAGPLVMAACRGLDVLMGARGSVRALPAALSIAVHTVGVTALSRGEVHGGTATDLGAALVATGAAAASIEAVAPSVRAPMAQLAGAAGAVGYLASALPDQLTALDDPSPIRVRDATRSAIGSVVPLQAALVARSGSFIVALGLAALDVLRRALVARRRAGDVT
ncbi:SCO3242 family prenyltransferase [Agromyces sp. NPDC058136]|uniref:SCO3242 family prenyltransferase n=1 Tax=Agromyces sp. NPDC058136 TaxID=3346354 RepID=UPI0036D89034